jgi:all-trans-retinol 13,14-reductase
MEKTMPGPKKDVFVDIVVIGAGLTGLMYAHVARQKGYRVALLEKHFKVGGYATNFMRAKRSLVFDCSQHKITGIGPTGNVRNALQRAKLWDKITFEPYQDLSTIRIAGKQYELPAPYPELKAYLYETFPNSATGLDTFFNDVETHGRQNYMFARMALGEYELDRDLLGPSRQLSKITAKSYFNSLFKDEDLVTIFSSIAVNLGAVAQEIDALYFLHFAFTFLTTGIGWVKGTSQSLSNTIAEAYEDNGGEIYLRESAESLKIEQGQVQYVETSRYRFHSNQVVATCCPHIIHQISTPESLGPKFETNLNKLKFGYGNFTVYLALDQSPESLGFTRSEYLIENPNTQHRTEEELAGDDRYQNFTIGLTNYHYLDPKMGPIVQIIVLDHKGPWFELDRKSYKEEKERVANILVSRMIKEFPQLEGHITYQEASTPKTNHRYTHSPEGSAFGYKALPGRNLRFLQRPKVDGLSFVGTWVSGAGYEPALCLGFTHAYLLPDKEQDSLALAG